MAKSQELFTDPSIVDVACAMLGAGLSVVPIRDKWENPAESKPFTFPWKSFQSERMSNAAARIVFDDAFGVAIVCGKVSGGLTVIDFDVPGYYEKWRELCLALELNIDHFPIETTINGGHHVFLRCEHCEQNQKLAELSIDGKRKTAIETRAEGGLIYCSPTPGYKLIQGSLTEIPLVSTETYSQLILVARSLCEFIQSINENNCSAKVGETGDRPGDIFNERESWDSILVPAGHRIWKSAGELKYWTREGKSSGVSMVSGLGKNGQDFLFVHTSNAPPLKERTGYSKFSAYTELQHGGDFKKAAKDIARRYGLPDISSTAQKADSVDDSWTPEFNFTDLGNALRLASLMDGNYRYCDKLSGWLIYDGKRFVKGSDEQIVRRLCITMIEKMWLEADSLSEKSSKQQRAWAKKSESRASIDSAVSLVKAVEGVSISPIEFNNDPFLLNVQNGVVDLRSGVLLPHDKKFLMTQIAGASFNGLGTDLKKQCPMLMKILNHAFSDSDSTAEWLLNFAGYSLTGSVSEEQFAFLFGEANAGKSKFTEAVEYVMGDYAARLPIQSLMYSRNAHSTVPSELATLNGIRMVLAVEAPAGSYFNTALIKSLVGETKIRVRLLYGEWFDMPINFKIWVTGNDRPLVREFDKALSRRLNIIPFNRPVRVEDRDSKLSEKLINEADAILSLLVQYCLSWQLNGLRQTAEMQKCLDEYEIESDVVKQFIEEWVRPCSGSFSLFSKVYPQFQRFCDKSGVVSLSKKAFSAKMKKAGFPGVKNAQGQVHFPNIEIIETED